MLLLAYSRWTCTADRLNGNGILRPDAWQVRRSRRPLASSKTKAVPLLLAAYWLLKKKAQEPQSPKPLDINEFIGCGGVQRPESAFRN